MNYKLLCAGLLVGSCLACTPREADIQVIGDHFFYATLEQPAGPDTKVYADEDLMILWHADDRVSVFDRYTYNQEYRFTGETGDNAGTLAKVPNDDLVTGNALDHIYAVYPYQASTRISNSGILTVSLPSEQIYAENNMAQGSNAMVSVTDGKNLRFKNLCGYLVLKLYGEGVSVSSVTVKGNADEPLAGNATVSMPVGGYPSLEMQPASATPEVTLTCPTPVLLGATADAYKEFWFVLPPTDFSAGFTVTVTGPDGSTFEKSTSNRIDIERNELNRMAPLEVVLEGGNVPPNNEIWYESWNGTVVEPYVREGFGANIISNTYNDGKGILQFDGEVTAIPDRAFYAKQLLSLILPNSVQSIGYSAFYRNAFESFTIPDGVVAIEGNPFCQCDNLVAFYGKYATEDHLALIKDETFLSFAIGTGAILESYSIPQGVKSVARYAFDGCLAIPEIILPNSLEIIGGGAFRSCRNVRQFRLPEGLKDINDDAFSDCQKLEEITIPQSVEHLWGNPFSNDLALRAFHGKFANEDERSLIVGDELVSFAPAGISVYSIPIGVISIGSGTFSKSELEEVFFPETLESISFNSFFGCSFLKSLTLPKGLKAIGGYAFYGCRSLDRIIIEADTPPQGGGSMFYDTNNCPIYVPSRFLEAYKATEYWSDYVDRIFPIEDLMPIPDAVDLGLPSGLKWASFNLGASKPEEYGDYYAWGETEPYYSSLDPLAWKEGKEAGYDWASYKWCMGSAITMTKYCNNVDYGYYGFIDDKTVLDSGDDAAYVNLGGNWRMPTDAEMTELRENCTWESTTLNGVNGRLVTGPNGNSIFLPAAGHWNNTDLDSVGSEGFFWSSSLDTDYALRAWGVGFLGRTYVGRRVGQSVRPVYVGPQIPVESVSLDKPALGLTVGETATLVASVLPINASNRMVTWASSDQSVATVSDSGMVTGVAVGSALITVTTMDGKRMATCNVTVYAPYAVAVPEAIDLGLPSGLKWASFNMGASKPEEFGDYFAWGETEPYYFSLNPKRWKEGKKDGYSWASYTWCNGVGTQLTKYCLSSGADYWDGEGDPDNKTVLDPEDDAARVVIGDGWRIPSSIEMQELINQCTWEWTMLNNVLGYKVTGPNGNNVFFPAAGLMNGGGLIDVYSGYYWSSDLAPGTGSAYAWYIYFNSGRQEIGWGNLRCFGFSIRPVTD